MYDFIIVPFDGSDAAQEAARVGADLSRATGARLRVVTATDAQSRGAIQALKDEAMRLSDDAVDVWVEPGRSPAEAINTVLEYHPSSLICMATSARSGIRRAVYGSLFEELLDRPDVPVLVLGPESRPLVPFDARHLVVCVDEDAASQQVVPLAAAWAKHFDLPITLLHIAAARAAGPAFDLRPIAAELETFASMVEPIVIFEDEPAKGLLGVFERSAGALAVMATHRRIGLSRLSKGSVVTDVVRHSPIPILVQRAPA